MGREVCDDAILAYIIPLAGFSAVGAKMETSWSRPQEMVIVKYGKLHLTLMALLFNFNLLTHLAHSAVYQLRLLN
jgi:hypothetical protein